ncbi:putative voltage gated chloride channel protein [Escherichia coli]|uniref:Putative voltage gated chloride channel protein n=1 Tax=Escherichia coli TaxID=562 RepID=A0A377D048_ECOLX|nr:putative voltage gated chloride channel protein [Escherichia coli]
MKHVPAVPAAITVSCAILGIVLVVTRDGWLSLFMAAVVVPNTTLLPLLCYRHASGLAVISR